ncbi:MAG TPA: signal peptidase I [Firmicutes bacterium]|nr:signal peptidase I [Bacillota bacterium]
MKILAKILSIGLTAFMLLLIGAVVVLAFSGRRSPDRIPTLAGHKVLTVLSGSMEPAIHTGDIVIVRPLDDNEEIKEGDIITFRTQEKADMLITHRVMGIIIINGAPAVYVTKGDANDAQDLATVARSQVVGTYAWRIPYFGYLVNFLRKPLGIILGVVLPGLILIAGEVRTIWQILGESEAAKNSEGGGTREA